MESAGGACEASGGGGKEMVQADIKKSRRGNKKAETVEIVGVANGRSHLREKRGIMGKREVMGALSSAEGSVVVASPGDKR